MGKTVLVLLVASTAWAGSDEQPNWTEHFSRRSVLKSFFQASERVSYLRFSPTPDQHKRLGQRLGSKAPQGKDVIFFRATTKGRPDGYAYIGEEYGKHGPITFAVKLSVDGKVLRQEVLRHREVRGKRICEQSFKQQFVGKTAGDPLRLGSDIDGITGATISSRVVTAGVKRALVLFDELINVTQGEEK